MRGLAVTELFELVLGMDTVLGEVCHRPFDVSEQFEPELACSGGPGPARG
jgi:hypothetical protein